MKKCRVYQSILTTDDTNMCLKDTGTKKKGIRFGIHKRIRRTILTNMKNVCVSLCNMGVGSIAEWWQMVT